MIKNTYVWVVSLVVLVLLVGQVGYRLLLREQSNSVVTIDADHTDRTLVFSNEDRVTNTLPDSEQADRSPAIALRSDLHQRLLTMPAPYRNRIFHMILRDVGAECPDVVSSQNPVAEISTWHAHCGETRTYSIVIDELGRTSVYPIPYGDFDASNPLSIPPIEPR